MKKKIRIDPFFSPQDGNARMNIRNNKRGWRDSIAVEH